MGKSPGADLFGCGGTWFAMVLIVVGVAVWGAIDEANANTAAQRQQQQMEKMATDQSATDYCVKFTEDTDRPQAILNTSYEKIGDLEYRVTVNYTTTMLGKPATLNEVCVLEWRIDGWNMRW